MRAIGVSDTNCKYEFRRNLRSHSWSAFFFFNMDFFLHTWHSVKHDERKARERREPEFFGPESTRNLPNRLSFFFSLEIEINMHLIGKKTNHQAGILIIITKNKIQQRSKKRLSRSNLVENQNSCRHGMYHVTEAGHANWCHVVG